jgi:hypothetical protein
MENRHKSTEFGGNYKTFPAKGVFKGLGVHKFYSFNPSAESLLSLSENAKPQKLSDHSYRLDGHVLKFYPPESFGFLGFCSNRGLPVEKSDIMGVNKEGWGDILLVDYIPGKNYKELLEKRGIFGLSYPKNEMISLGKTFYEFAKQGILQGDSHPLNYIYDGEKAVRIDLIPGGESLLSIDWDEINCEEEGFLKSIEKNKEAVARIHSDSEAFLRCLATELSKHKFSFWHYSNNVRAFLKGFVNDKLSAVIGGVAMNTAQKYLRYIIKAKKEKKTFEDIFWDSELNGRKEIVIDMTGLH